MLSEKSSPPGKSGNAICCEQTLHRQLRTVAIKHLVKLSVGHEFFFAIFFLREKLVMCEASLIRQGCFGHFRFYKVRKARILLTITLP